MKTNLLAAPFALALLALGAHAQAPIFFNLPPGAIPTDVCVSSSQGVVVVGTAPGGAFRWTPTGGLLIIGVNGVYGSTVRISADGTKIAADEAFAPTVTSVWDGTTWTPIPGLGADQGGVQTTTGDINADGTIVVGMGYSVNPTNHGYRWTQGVGTFDLGPFFNSPGSRALGVNGDGSIIVGWQQQSMQVGVKWVNGVMSTFNYIDPGMVSHFTQHATAVNTSGSIIVGKGLYGLTAKAWRWDSGTSLISPLSNLGASSATPVPNGLTDDGSVIVGNDGSPTLMGARTAVLWHNGVAMNPLDYYTNLGMASTGYTNLSTISAITTDGSALCGSGVVGAPGQPEGWVIVFPHLLPTGTPECIGDTAAACPCSGAGGSLVPNAGAAGNGCGNSSFPAGAHLVATGSAVDNAGDTLSLTCSNMPGPGLFFQANGLAGPIVNFNDGVLCAASGIIRMGVVFPTAGVATYPGGLTPNPIHIAGGPVLLGGSPTPDTKHYQCWYRDITVGFCNVAGHNMSNGVAIVWAP